MMTITANTYDAFGRLIRTRLSPGTPDERVIYEAETDATGQTATERMATVERTTVRDIRGTVASWSTPWMSQRLRRISPGRIAGKVTSMADGTTRRYGYTYSDLVNFIDPTGLYITRNINENSSPYMICVYGNPMEKEATDRIMTGNFSHDYANGIPILLVNDYDDCVEGLNDLTSKYPDIQLVIFNSHGSIGSFKIGKDKITINTDFTKMNRSLHGKKVFVSACETGEGVAGQILTSKMAKETSSDVYTSRHNLLGGYNFIGARNKRYGNTSLNYPTLTTDLKVLEKNNGFTYSQRGMPAIAIYNLQISINGKITWTKTVLPTLLCPLKVE